MIEKISVNCQSSIKINSDKIIYFDPYKIENESHDADLIFITHDHYDHYDTASIKNIMKDDTIIVIPDKMAPKVLATFASENIIGVIPNEVYEIKDLPIKTIPSYNISKSYHPQNAGWVGYIVTLEEENIYVAGDTDATEEAYNVICDIAIVPIGGTYTMDSHEAASLINKIKPKYAIPTHYVTIVGTIQDGIDFKNLIDKNIECRLLIGEKK